MLNFPNPSCTAQARNPGPVSPKPETYSRSLKPPGPGQLGRCLSQSPGRVPKLKSPSTRGSTKAGELIQGLGVAGSRAEGLLAVADVLGCRFETSMSALSDAVLKSGQHSACLFSKGKSPASCPPSRWPESHRLEPVETSEARLGRHRISIPSRVGCSKIMVPFEGPFPSPRLKHASQSESRRKTSHQVPAKPKTKLSEQ